MMNGVCQNCGASAPIEWFLADVKYRQCLVLMGKLPPEAAEAAIGYLSLFRPASGRAITAGKLQRLLAELLELISAGHVQVRGKVARPCPSRIWARAMEEMLTRRDHLDLPMPNHNYLRQVAWGLADEADAAAEREREMQAGYRYHRPSSAEGPVRLGEALPDPEDDERCSPEVAREKIRRMLQRTGSADQG